MSRAAFADVRVAAGARRVDAHRLGLKGINPQEPPAEGLLESLPGPILAQEAQHGREAVVGEVERGNLGIQGVMECMEALLDPGLDVAQAMVAAGENVGEPDGQEVAHVEAVAVAMGGKWSLMSAGSPMRCMWVSKTGMSSTRSVSTVSGWFMPRAYGFLPNPAKNQRTMSQPLIGIVKIAKSPGDTWGTNQCKNLH